MFAKIRLIIQYYQKWKFVYATKNLLYYFLTREKKKKYGKKNPDKTIYIIRSIKEDSCLYTGAQHNLLANYFYVLSHIKYAKDKGWVPVVDQKNYPVYNSQKQQFHGSNNPWEYFWTQPSNLSLEEAYCSKKVVLSKRSWYGQWDMGYLSNNYYDQRKVAMYHELMNNVPVNNETQEFISKIKEEYFPQKGKIMGVAYRYGGHSVSCYYKGEGHPSQPAIDEFLELVTVYLNQWEMDYIFLTSDEQMFVDKLRDLFGDRVIALPRIRMIEGMTYDKVHLNPMRKEGQINQTALEYIAEMELLAQCDSLLGTITSGFRYAFLKNNFQYDYFKIIENGFFDDKRRK